MDIAEARRRFLSRNKSVKAYCRRQAEIGRQARSARSRVRFEQALALSEAGVSIHHAADRLGMTYDGLKTLLYRTLGTSEWPITKEHTNG